MNTKEDINNAFNTISNDSDELPPTQTIQQPNESNLRFFLRKLFVRKNLTKMMEATQDTGMKRNLNVVHLTCIGIGCIIGTGIFIYSGTVAANEAGPAVILCFAIAGFVATLSAICYAEIASMIPVAGSAYSYTYATMGEFVSWIVGWCLILEYMVGTAAVGVGWSGYLMRFFNDAFGWKPITPLIGAFVAWEEENQTFVMTSNYFNLPAVIIIMLCTILLIFSARESATATTIGVFIKIAVILLFIFACCPDVDVSRYNPFVPDAIEGVYGKFGPLGVLKGTSIVFFCFTGFDTVSTAAQEVRNPERNLPIAIIGSLTISTILYISVCLVLIGIIPYELLNDPSPITKATGYVGKNWLSIAVGLSAVLGMLTSMIGGMMAQARIFYTMSRDGLLPRLFGKVHPKFGTPWISQLIVGIAASLLAGIFPVDLLGALSGMGTLFGYFLVCIGVIVLRIKRPDLKRSFKVPFGPFGIPLLGALLAIALVFSSAPSSLARLFIWIGIGILIYFIYGYHNSRVNHPEKFHLNDFEKIIRS